MESNIIKDDSPAEEVRDALTKCAEYLNTTEGCISGRDTDKAQYTFSQGSDCFNEAFISFQDLYTDLIQLKVYGEVTALCDEFTGNLQRINKIGRALGFNMLGAVKAIESEIAAIRASCCIAEKDFLSAMKIYDASIKKNKHSATVWIARGMCLNELEKYKEAIRSIEKGIAAEEDSQRGWFCKGIAYLRSKRYERALESFEEAVLADTSKQCSYYYMLLAYLGLNLKDEAEKLIKRLLKKDPGPEDYYTIYLIQAAFKNEAEAEDAKSHALEMEPDIASWQSVADIKSEIDRITAKKK
ncbi:tetratricopeptide repeat protein [Methanoplanus endosymbiosus]|uniref:Tetratricopeptide repeat protein n=1 Tax=Methanoplanus endosymbiosus TaxID=33865 RepID=A0A9E7PLR3_9EURY|nr:tetratricopeptide repeat protein [Methanoplanus endosymbiosus]UUX92498.1 tetratricopeptide repeat protein [Methanoplanus endosymbiosus]